MNPRHQRSPKNLTLNDICPKWFSPTFIPYPVGQITGGVLYTLANFSNDSNRRLPWQGNDKSINLTYGNSLDYVYHGQRSGNKFITELVYQLLSGPYTGYNEGIPVLLAETPKFVDVVIAYYYDKWKHLWDAYATQYNALHSYAISDTESVAESETTTPNLTDTTTVTDSINDSENETRTPNITEGLQIAGSDTKTPNIAENETVTETRNTTDETTYGKQTTAQGESTENGSLNTYGFNSSEAVPKEASTDHIVSGQTSTDSGKDTIKGTGTITTGRQFARTGTEGDSYSENSTRQTTGTEQKNRSAVRQRAGGNTVHKTGTATVSGTRSVTRTRSGNMFKSPAELLSQDREFWMTHYFEIIFDDLDKVLTLPIFSEKDVNFKVY